MTVPLVINGQTYDYPETGDVSWGPDATDWATAVTTGMLQKAGGLFTLLAEVDFGASFGIKSLYYKSRTALPADAGQIRLANANVVSWRNAGNSANLDLGIGGTNELYFDGSPVQNIISILDTNSIDLTLSSRVLSADLKLSANAADSGFINAANTVESTGSAGLQTQVAILVGDTGSGGTAGVAPAPPMGAATSFLRGDGTWASPPGAAYTFSDTNSIDLTETLGDVTADLNLSVAAADAGYVNAVLSVESDGLQAQVLKATADAVSFGVVTSFAPVAKSSTHAVSSADYTVLDNDGYQYVLVSTGNTTRTVTLPTAADNIGRLLVVKKTDSGTGVVTVDGEGSEAIDGALTQSLLYQYDEITVACDGAGWVIVDKYFKPLSVQSSSVTTAASTNGTRVDAQTLTLNPGIWYVWAHCGYSNASATINDIFLASISTTSVTDNMATFFAAPTLSGASSTTQNNTGSMMVTVAAGSTQIIYLVASKVTGAATGDFVNAQIFATRVG